MIEGQGWALRFLGVGNALAPALGNSSAVVERDGQPLLLIDCGPLAIDAYVRRYGSLPSSVFITHCHLDHVGGMEALFAQAMFGPDKATPRLFVPAGLVALLHARVADYPGVTAEGGSNFWDPFRLVPVSGGFWLDGYWFDVFPVRHGTPGSAFGLRLKASLVFTGDTRPIPEVLAGQADSGELVAHDSDLNGNPAHSGIDELEREYPAELRQRLLIYHYADPAAADAIAGRGFRVARTGIAYPLNAPADRRGAP